MSFWACVFGKLRVADRRGSVSVSSTFADDDKESGLWKRRRRRRTRKRKGTKENVGFIFFY